MVDPKQKLQLLGMGVAMNGLKFVFLVGSLAACDIDPTPTADWSKGVTAALDEAEALVNAGRVECPISSKGVDDFDRVFFEMRNYCSENNFSIANEVDEGHRAYRTHRCTYEGVILERTITVFSSEIKTNFPVNCSLGIGFENENPAVSTIAPPDDALSDY